MLCHGVTIPGSDARFYLQPNLTFYSAVSNKRSIFLNTQFTKSQLSSKNAFESLKAKATVNDGVVIEANELSFYELLGISESDSLMEIKQAYKQLARKYHPDVSPTDRVEEYTRRFIRVQEAYETLSDPRRRAMYDKNMARGLHLAFSARRRYYDDDDETIEEKGDWRNRWQDQLSELKRRSMNKDVGNMSWGARMREQRAGSSEEA